MQHDGESGPPDDAGSTSAPEHDETSTVHADGASTAVEHDEPADEYAQEQSEERGQIAERRRGAGRRLAASMRRKDTVDYDKHRGIDWVIFGVTSVLAIAFVVWGLVATANFSSVSTSAFDWTIQNTGWAFVLLASLFVFYVIWLALSRYGAINLGADGEKPEFKTVSWIAMMFSAGMGIGLMFYGVAEPLWHFVAPPPDGADPATYAAAENAMATSMFHWTLHPWAIYAVVGVALAYGTFRRGRSQLMSSIFEPLLGDHVNGLGGKLIDMLAIFATLFGSAASLGLGALQIAGGIEKNGWAESVSTTVLVLIIVVLTVCFILSATSGVAKGIQWLSNINMVLALILAVFVFIAGPTIFILDIVPETLFAYVDDLPSMMARTDAAGSGAMADWLATWTVFYWAWWISWTPFVGMFIARISRGRTIRQFVAGVLFVPSVVSLIWFAIFGGAGIHEEMLQPGSVGVTYDKAGVGTFTFESALFDLLANYPLASVMSVLVMALVAIFFVSGADAASIVMGTLSEKGVTEPTRPTVIFWGAATGAVAAIMLMAGGGGSEALTSLQNITIVAAVPFVVVMAFVMVSLTKDLRTDPKVLRAEFTEHLFHEAVVAGVQERGEDFSLLDYSEPPDRSGEVTIGRFGERLQSDREPLPRDASLTERVKARLKRP